MNEIIFDWTDIAKAGYQAYSESRYNQNFRGEEMPKWDDLPQSIKEAWEAAALRIGRRVAEQIASF